MSSLSRMLALALLLNSSVLAQAQPNDGSKRLLSQLTIELNVAGQDIERPWSDFLAHLLDYFDLDRDGNLNADEVARMMPLPLPDRRVLAVEFAALDADSNQLATLTELSGYLRQRGFTPVVVEYVASSEQDQQLSMLFEQTLLPRIPTDGDPPSAFRRYDLNDNEAWELDEFLAFDVQKSLEMNPLIANDNDQAGQACTVHVDLSTADEEAAVTASETLEVRLTRHADDSSPRFEPSKSLVRWLQESEDAAMKYRHRVFVRSPAVATDDLNRVFTKFTHQWL